MPIDLTEQERIVLNLVQEYLNKNRFFEINKVLSFIKYRLRRTSINIDYYRIEAILKSLIEKKLILERSKLSHSNILLNTKRKAIYEHIIKNPGTYFNKIMMDLKFSNHVVIWHLEILIEFNFIKKELINHREFYFDSVVKQDDMRRIYILSNKNSKKIINYLYINKRGILKSKIARDLKMHLNTVNKYLDFLEKFGIVTSQTKAEKTLYFIGENFLNNSEEKEFLV